MKDQPWELDRPTQSESERRWGNWRTELAGYVTIRSVSAVAIVRQLAFPFAQT